LIARKIFYILRLKCTKFDFGRRSSQHSTDALGVLLPRECREEKREGGIS